MQWTATTDRGARCMGNAHPIDGRPQNEVQVGPDKLEVVASFCYLGDMLSAGGGCEIAVTTRVKTAWKKIRELLPIVISRHLSYKTWERSGSVVECLTQDRRAVGSSLTGVTVLCP